MDHLPEEFTGSDDHTLIVKGKRTKRQRPSSPFGMAVTSSSSSGGGGGGGGDGGGGGGGGGGGDVYFSFPSPTTSSEISTSTDEDEDMANCLILLAQGLGPRQDQENQEGKNIEKLSNRKLTDMYVYECKTCNRTFPSFQALGGHRASHKKSKAMVEEKKPLHDHEEGGQFNNFISSSPLSLQMATSTNKPKVHECSICGSEFSSGQALGGHMRRHRSAPANPRIAMNIDTSSTYHEQDDKPTIRNILHLDLNLPAPEDDLRDSKFQFTPNQQHLVFSAAPALVDCHY